MHLLKRYVRKLSAWQTTARETQMRDSRVGEWVKFQEIEVQKK